MTASKKYSYPKTLPLLKFFWYAEAIRKNPIPYHNAFFETYGDTFSVRLGKNKYLLLSRDKDFAQYILQKNQKNYNKSKIQTQFLSKYLGNGLLTANGAYWLKQRRLIQPAFHKEKMEQLVALMNTTIVSELDSLASDAPLDVFSKMNQLAFNVVATSLFHVSPSDTSSEEKQERELQLNRLQTIIQKVQEFLVKEVRLPHKGWWFRLSGQVDAHKKLSEESRTILGNFIEERRNDTVEHGDLLDLLLATRYEDTGEPMSTKQLIDEITILFVAGHETTANALTFTTFLLAKHPEICQKVFEEVCRVESQTTNVVERLKLLEYTRACIDEAMRLYPPAWITDRENIEDDTITNFHIKKDTLVGVSFYEIHRNPKYWDQPDVFDPTRFLGDNKKKTAGCYFPFGAGPRMCIGMGFAIYEMLLATSYLVKKYTLSTAQDSITLHPLITLKPVDVKVIFSERNDIS
ncbi:Cytochrome P450 [Ulvibacter litoralis]|uniref:Cytochrome P450 n=1 Tax=Ulvibacter litoralis TaxID=227084 RepID=A0A1G7DUY9_9FLAO|nr:cytochrome P450 [Ulvibacter litoralis]SDE55222.1 Cytochrome P450 [Ulvibacter litoralis]